MVPVKIVERQNVKYNIDSKYAYYIEKAKNCYIVKPIGFTLLPVVLYCVFWEDV